MRRASRIGSLAAGTALVVASALFAPAGAATPTGAARTSRPGPCPGLVALEVAGHRICTHGGDDLANLPAAAPREAALRSTLVPATPCPGNGVSGRRVRVLYGYPAGTHDRSAEARAVIRLALRSADANLDAQTPETGGQHYRFWCRRDSMPTIASVRLRAIGADHAYSVADVIDSLVAQRSLGFGTHDFVDDRFVYLTFVDHLQGVSAPAGQATFLGDDDPDPAVNRNNSTSQMHYGMVMLGYSAANESHLFQHEVGHTIGAVQLSSPHSSGAAHCYDVADVMCYDDGGPWFSGGGTLQPLCVAMPDGQDPWDCGGDDWYAASPADGTYLADHWNVVDSGWLSWTT
jgi:hypothetical protein